MRITIIVIALFSLMSCQSNKLINIEGVNKLIVMVDPLKTTEQTRKFRITNEDSIAQIVNMLNHAKKELAKFRPTYSIEIQYFNGQKVNVLCNANRINIEGVTYKLNEDIETLLLHVCSSY